MKIWGRDIPIIMLFELLICFTLLTLLLFARIMDISNLTLEDSIIEYLSALFWLSGVVLSSIYLIQKRKSLIIIILCIVCFISFGEEISWGQRILNISTPKTISDLNRQSEINLHNMYFISANGSPWRNFFKTGVVDYKQFIDAQNMFRIGFIIYFLIFPLCMRYSIYTKLLTN